MNDEDKTEPMTPKEKYEYQIKSREKSKESKLSQAQWLDFFSKIWKTRSAKSKSVE